MILIGAPGAGKSSLARKLSVLTSAPHIEADRIFWTGKNLRSELDRLTDAPTWILEGHLSKHHDLTFPKADGFLIITGNPLVYLLRSLKRDLRAPSKFWFNLKNHSRMERKRQDLIRTAKRLRPGRVFYLENLSYPPEGELKALGKALEAAPAQP